ncbi:hypothetical protein ABW19_dt0209750 [Dactylella cylindrospora]|nr:hypothetical protein ABW19_dt0209750 [Dactylella cylindrospora]
MDSRIATSETDASAIMLFQRSQIFLHHHTQTGDIDALESAIKITEYAVGAALPNRIAWNGHFGELLVCRFQQMGDMKDLDRAIEVQTAAQDLMSPHHANDDLLKLSYQILQYVVRVTKRVGDVDNLCQCKELAEKLFDSVPANYEPDNAEGLSSMAKWYLHHFQLKEAAQIDRSERLRDLNQAIEFGKKALELLSYSSNIKEAIYVTSDLGLCLYQRFFHTFHLDDLQQSINFSEAALTLIAPQSSGITDQVMNLLESLGTYCMETRSIGDFDKAIKLVEKYMDQVDNEEDRGIMRATLLEFVVVRIGLTESMEDILQAIKIAKDFLATASPDHPKRGSVAGLYAGALARLYNRTGAIEHLDRAIEQLELELSIATSPIDHVEVLNNLGRAYHQRFDSTGQKGDIDKALEFLNRCKSVQDSLPDRSYLYPSLWSLSRLHYAQFQLSSNMADLTDAIDASQLALEVLPPYHNGICTLLSLQGLLYFHAYLITRRQDYFEKGREALDQVQSRPDAPPIKRLSGITMLAGLHATRAEWKEASLLMEEGLRLFTLLSPRSMHNIEKQHTLAGFHGVASTTAAILLKAERDPSYALRQLELGRGLTNSLMLEMRLDISDLRNKYPKLAKQYQQLQEKLEVAPNDDSIQFPASSAALNSIVEADPFSVKTAALMEWRNDSRQEAEAQFNKLLGEIRAKPGFETFLMALTSEQLMAAANPDPIVVINVDGFGSDAFIVESHQIRSIPLPYLKARDIENKIEMLKGDDEAEAWAVLEWLWDTVAGPILEALNINSPPTENEWPRIWWIPTGQLAQLPLHAAGRHFTGSGETVLDRVISSYALSIKSLVYGQNRKIVIKKTEEFDNALLVAMADTNNRMRLSFARTEVDMLEKQCSSLRLNPVKPPRRRSDILSHLPTCKIFHFAGHGYANPVEPSQSALLLEDWEESPLTVADFWKQNLQNNPPFLAYLSACSTGATPDEFSDEGAHLITACQLSGFRHVIGTLWEVNDAYCVQVAERFYSTFHNKEMTDETVPLALHEALRYLRDRSAKVSHAKGSTSRPSSKSRGTGDPSGAAVSPLEDNVAREETEMYPSSEPTSLLDSSLFVDILGIGPFTKRRGGRGPANNVGSEKDNNDITDREEIEPSETYVREMGLDESGASDDRNLVRIRRKKRKAELYWVPYVHYGV